VAVSLVRCELLLAFGQQLLTRLQVRASLRCLLLNRVNLRFALLQLLLENTDFVSLRARVFDRDRAVRRLLLELINSRGQLARLVGELELALVELARPRDQPFLVLPALGGPLGLALLEHLFPRLQLHTHLGRLLLRRRELRLALRQLLLELARLAFGGVCLLLALFERLDQLLVPRLRLSAGGIDPRLGMSDLLLTSRQVFDLVLPLAGRRRPLLAGLLQLADLEFDQLFAFLHPR